MTANGRIGWWTNPSDQESILAESEETENRRAALADALGVLNPRERRIFEARRLADDPMTLEGLSTEFGISRERVRQIEVRAFEKVQQAAKRARRPGRGRRAAGAAGRSGAGLTCAGVTAWPVALQSGCAMR